jgi:tetratricopeptide (TPR) repeat protein
VSRSRPGITSGFATTGFAAAGLVVALASACWSWGRMETLRSANPAAAQVLYLPSGKYLKIVSLGFPEVMADLVYIWSIQFYSNYDQTDRFKFLEHIYGNVISELDPKYIDPYLIGALIMSAEAHQDEMALRLLDKGIEANPSEWILPFDAGFLCYDHLHDYPRAALYFEKALAIPGAPKAVKRLHAEMYNKMGDKRASLGYWRDVLEGADTDYIRSVASEHVHDLAIEVDLETLRHAVESWRAEAGGNPPDLEALARRGLIERVPVDPEGNAYLYDRNTGEISCRSPFKLHRRTAR